jgi:hypothetical protein
MGGNVSLYEQRKELFFELVSGTNTSLQFNRTAGNSGPKKPALSTHNKPATALRQAQGERIILMH